MRRIGIVGTENSHVDHFIRHLNGEHRHPGNRVVALAGGRTDRNRALGQAAGIDLVVDEPGDLVGRVDAAIVSGRDGHLHREQAVPLLAAGIPVLVDKPLAASVADARAIIAAAEHGKAPLVSCSALRFAPEISRFDEAASVRRALRQVAVTGPADPDSEYAGLFFYGIHHVEAALQLLGDPVIEPGSLLVQLSRHADTTIALIQIDQVALIFTFLTPSDGARVPFHATVANTKDIVASTLTLGPDYNAPALARFIEACDRGSSPVDHSVLLSSVAVMAAITDSLVDHQASTNGSLR